MKTVNLARVQISPKYIVYMIIAFIVALIAWTVANFVFGKIRGVTGVATSKVTGGTAGSGW